MSSMTRHLSYGAEDIKTNDSQGFSGGGGLELQIHSRMDVEFILCESVMMKQSKAAEKEPDIFPTLS